MSTNNWSEEQELKTRELATKLSRALRDASEDDSVTLTAMVRACGAVLGTARWNRREFSYYVEQFVNMVRDSAKVCRACDLAARVVAEKLDPNRTVKQ